ncbi:hypothetical protein RJ640_015396 [Escallonia rubra]|uniref:Exocyst subunit Exo70 family protein n=2 Tax=Escallonia rubra TaxID=112253 RepID=A0AA88QXX9_9ASTE|nr:hypothetical protein RJ640_015396 [Escallonia rubra]
MRSIFFSSSKPSSPPHSHGSSSTPGSTPPLTPPHTFSVTMMEENIEYAESLVTMWDVDGPTYNKLSPLFTGDRKEAKDFLKSVKDLQAAMNFFASQNSSAEKMVRAQKLMQTAMKRLEREFYQILTANRNLQQDAESVLSRSSRASTRSSASDDDASDDEYQVAGNSVSELVMADLRSIAECMISAGYGRECVKIYKIIRKSIVDESLYYLGVEKLSSSQVQKMDWDVVEAKIKSWLKATTFAVKTLFYGERILCDDVFSVSEKIAESSFTEISKDAALMLFGFPELVAKGKKTPEKMFKVMDLYDTVSELWPEIESIFSFESTSAVRSAAANSLVKLGDAIRLLLSDFETAIQKDTSKTPVPGGGVHPLTRYVMNYIVFLCDYTGVLSDIVADWPLSVHSPLPESYFSSPIADESSAPAISERFAWIVLVLLCKLDSKVALYKDVSLSYLFLANNLNYVVSKVRNSKLKLLLGDDWLAKHEIMVSQYAANYERMGWSKAMSSLPTNPTISISIDTVEEHFKSFNSAFEEEYRKQVSWIIIDSKLRDEVKVSLAKKLVPAYRAFYEKYRGMFQRKVGVDSAVRFAPDDLDNYLSDLFYGAGVEGSSTSFSSAASARDQGGH